MAKKTAEEILAPYQKELTPLLQKMSKALFRVLNQGDDPNTLTEYAERLLEIRESINTTERMGAIIGAKFTIVVFPLTGDAHHDIGQGKPTFN